MSEKIIKFEAVIQAGDAGGAFVFFPFDTIECFGTNARIPVLATIDGEAYTGSMVKYGYPQHILPILKKTRNKIGKQPGDRVTITVQKDEAKREIILADEIEKIFQENEVSEIFRKASYSHQREWVKWITEAKRAETKDKRIVKVIEQLRAKAVK